MNKLVTKLFDQVTDLQGKDKIQMKALEEMKQDWLKNKEDNEKSLNAEKSDGAQEPKFSADAIREIVEEVITDRFRDLLNPLVSDDEHFEDEEDVLSKRINLLNRKVKTVKRLLFGLQSNSRDMHN